MFKIAEKRIVEWPVTIQVPQDGGRVKKVTAQVEFEVIGQSEFDAIYQGGGGDAELMQRVVRGWPDGQFADERGELLPCTPENLARLMEIAYVRLAFATAYLQLAQGREAARKN
jgi:hypothetical protein